MKEARPLAGQRIVVTAYDLEQTEHRGIAVYSKATIRVLHALGAEIWLLTEFEDELSASGLRKLPDTTRSIIHSARILDALVHGERGRAPHWIENKLPLVRKLFHWLRQIDDALEFVRRPRHYKTSKLNLISFDELQDNPYLRHERLDYLRYCKGLICAKRIYFATQVAALMKRQRPVTIDLEGFDAFLTCCPLNIKPLNTQVFTQTVHDVIPLEYAQTSDNTLGFSHRLQACMPSRRLFVSRSTAQKFNQRVAQYRPTNPRESVLIQPPSLRFPSWILEDPEQCLDLEPVSYLLRPDQHDQDRLELSDERSSAQIAISSRPKYCRNGKKAKQSKRLQPFRYFLFNSSVEARKNLLFLTQSFIESGLSQQGIKLCVTGKLKKDSYSQAVKELVAHEPNIVLTGYIDESTKLDLYLNTMGLLSPSLVEGFGIPVLDGACLGVPTIASDCDSHLEIKALHDFNDYVIPVNIFESRDWAAAMQSIAGLGAHHLLNDARERRRRICRYEHYSSQVIKQYQQDLATLMQA